MNCLACLSPGSTVLVEVEDYESVIRQRQCKCGFKWVTAETSMTARPAVNARQRELSLPATRVNEVSGRVEGDLGGVLDPGLSLLPSDPSQQSGSGARACKASKDNIEYPSEFLALWALAKAQGKAGNKLPAFKSWGKATRVNATLVQLILTRFEEWTRTDAWRRGFNQHLSTWLNQRGWEEPPTDADIAGSTNARPGANGAATGPSPKRSDYCDDHLDGRSKLWSSRPTATCPECKHQRAKYPRHPRVVSMEELFGKETG